MLQEQTFSKYQSETDTGQYDAKSVKYNNIVMATLASIILR